MDAIKMLVLQALPTVIIVAIFVASVNRYKKRGKYSPFTQEFLREPGHTLRVRLEELNIDFIINSLLALTAGLVATYVIADLDENMRVIGLVVFLLLILFFVYRALSYFRESVQVRLGLEGERATGEELTLLMHNGAWVFHDIPYAYGNIDHIVVSTSGVFAVETKAVSKPESKINTKAEWKMEFDGTKLKFPHWQGENAIVQARLHAKHLRKVFRKKLDIDANVIPVVAIPGWFVKNTGKSDVWVVNPKNRHEFCKQIAQKTLSDSEVKRVAAYIESVVRSVRPGSKKLDPDSSKHYDFWNKPRYKPPSVD